MSQYFKWNPFLKCETHLDLNQQGNGCLGECWKESVTNITPQRKHSKIIWKKFLSFFSPSLPSKFQKEPKEI